MSAGQGTAAGGPSTGIVGPYPQTYARFPYIRQSDLSDFDNCALTSAFAVGYERGWSSHDAARGTIVHRTIAKALERMMENKEDHVPVDVVVDDIFPEVCRQADVEMESKALGSDVLPLPIRQQAQARISLKAWAHNQRFTPRDFAGIEKRLTTVLHYPDEGGFAVPRAVTGQLDLLLIRGDHAKVVDWKDTFGIPPESSISEEGYFQQRFYALLVFREYPRIQRVTLREFYVRYSSGKTPDRKTGRPIKPEREATIDRFALPEIEGEMAALVERFDRAHETGIFKPAPGSHCSYCARPGACPIFPTARMEGRITSKAEAEKVAAELNVAEAVANQARKTLRAWAKNHGDVAVKDAKRPRAFGPVVRKRTDKPDLRQVRQYVSEGRPLDELYQADEYLEIGMHSPEEEHPFAAEARLEEEMLLAAEKAAGERGRKKGG